MTGTRSPSSRATMPIASTWSSRALAFTSRSELQSSSESIGASSMTGPLRRWPAACQRPPKASAKQVARGWNLMKSHPYLRARSTVTRASSWGDHSSL